MSLITVGIGETKKGFSGDRLYTTNLYNCIAIVFFNRNYPNAQAIMCHYNTAGEYDKMPIFMEYRGKIDVDMSVLYEKQMAFYKQLENGTDFSIMLGALWNGTLPYQSTFINALIGVFAPYQILGPKIDATFDVRTSQLY